MSFDLNSDQQKAFDLVKNGKNVFITGSAGTGKSFVIGKIIEWGKQTGRNIGVTSSTGISALNINGKTLHSFLGIGLGKNEPHALYLKSRKLVHLVKKLNDLSILIIDEISMISSELFDKVSEYLSLMRKNDNIFGGVQVILCGDMCQLPPVGGNFCFKSRVWSILKLNYCMLKIIIRQQEDEHFKTILEDARFGKISDENIKLLRTKRMPNFGEIKPTILYSKNVDVDAVNQIEYAKQLTLNKNTSPNTFEHVFETVYMPDTEEMRIWASSVNIQPVLNLCVGTQVMVTVNLDVENGIANGTRGMITEFTNDGEPIIVTKSGDQIIIQPHVYIKDDDGKSHPKFVKAIPLKLAYALTVHKSQSCTLDAAIIDLGTSIFEYGQAYTSLSRVRDLNSVHVTAIRKESFKANPDVIDFYSKF